MAREGQLEHGYRNHLSSLYEDEENLIAVRRRKGTNAGLWLDKYIRNQSRDDTKSRSDLVREVSEIVLPDVYRTFYRRWMQGLKDMDARKYIAETKGRMVVGLGDESVLETSIALHHTYGVPYIPGSALKGLAASYARQRLDQNDWGKASEAYRLVFGDTDESGYITFFDALPHIDAKQASVSMLAQDIITVHHSDYYRSTNDNYVAPADWDSPTPIPLLSAQGEFLIALAVPPDLDNGQIWLDKTFTILSYALGEMGIGAKTSSGYGRMTLKPLAIL